MKRILVSAALLALGLGVAHPVAAEPTSSKGTITIPVSEYEKLKEAVEAKKEKQYWNMTFYQILDEVNGNREKAWSLYKYYVLRQIDLIGSVDLLSVKDLIEDISILEQIDKSRSIRIVMTSGGGGVYEGLMLYNAMMGAEPPIITVCDGVVASMAAVLFAAGDHRVAMEGCHFMIHELAGPGKNGQTTSMLTQTEHAIDLENILYDILAENTGLSRKAIRTLGEYETFYSAEEIRRLGFADAVASGKPRVLKAGDRQIPDDLLPANRIKENIAERMAE